MDLLNIHGCTALSAAVTDTGLIASDADVFSSGKTSRHQLYAVNFNVQSALDATANAKVSLAKRRFRVT